MRAYFYPVIAASALLFGCATDEANKPAATAPVTAAKPAAKPQAVESKPVTTVQAGADGFKILQTVNLGDTLCFASIAIAQGQIFIRTGQNLYCIGGK